LYPLRQFRGRQQLLFTDRTTSSFTFNHFLIVEVIITYFILIQLAFSSIINFYCAIIIQKYQVQYCRVVY